MTIDQSGRLMMRLLALLATLVFTHAAWAAGPAEVDRIVAVVNSDVVTRDRKSTR